MLSILFPHVDFQDCVDFITKPAPAVRVRLLTSLFPSFLFSIFSLILLTPQAQEDDTRLVFVVDISGSMCVSVPVVGRKTLRGSRRSRLEEDVR